MDGLNTLQLVTDVPPQDGPIAVFDSGVGGLSVVREIRRRLPGETIVYFGDTARVPYGSKSKETVLEFSREIIDFLMRMQPKCIVVACNTVSAACLPDLANEVSVPLIGVVRPGAAALHRALGGAKLAAVIGTNATITSNAYASALSEMDSDVVVVQKACPLLVPLVEDGRDPDDPLVRMAVTQYLEPIAWLKPKALVLACTHYPLLRPAIDKVLGPEVTLIDPAVATADYVAKTIGHSGVLRGQGEPGKLLCYVSDNPQFFQTIGQRFLREPIPGVVCLRPRDLSRAVPMAAEPAKRAAAV